MHSALITELEGALVAGDEPRQAALRAQLLASAEGALAAEAGYRLGLYQLYRQQDLEAAAASFKAAAGKKTDPWSLMARTALGLVRAQQGSLQQAFFELRRAAGKTPPSLLSAQAGALLVTLLSEAGRGGEANKAEEALYRQLDLLGRSEDPEVGPPARLMRALEHKKAGERAPAKALLAALLSEGQLSAELSQTAQAALAEL